MQIQRKYESKNKKVSFKDISKSCHLETTGGYKTLTSVGSIVKF